MTRYRTIVADPPWDHSDGTGVLLTIGLTEETHPEYGRKTATPYSALTVPEIAALPVASLADADAHLYLWATNRYVRHTWAIAEAWGFTGVRLLTWCKPRRGWLPGGAFPSDSEFCLFARRGSLATLNRAPGSWFEWPRRSGDTAPTSGHRSTDGHSAKPEAFLDMVEQVSPGPYLELFARRQRLGWDTYGDQALEHVAL
jgi:N6-adenosine-specific RNA methylase IME4